MPPSRPIEFESLGLRPFAEVLGYQKELRQRRQAGEIVDRVLFVEHPRVITRGRRPADEDFRVPVERLREAGFQVEDAGRGGKLTYHGPGQLVAYFIVSLRERRWGIPEFVRRIEAAILQCLAEYGIAGERRAEYPGVWIGGRKIASIGLSVDRGVSMNGIALNVDPRLEDFETIVPCGIPGCEMTSIRRETNQSPGLEEVSRLLADGISDAFVEEAQVKAAKSNL
ncbi:MAG: lipoyl(octanoyl) transferase LipB [Deltaproteobacteria bacterium]|nr:lipoyl(octanoyl) transferase LipB [Deltaproteobacteria bacterium]